ncbi:HNH endonuclease [Patescibacteria group bacterium]|nr:HNH endonuclease [Patescibacteria group bacterium]
MFSRESRKIGEPPSRKGKFETLPFSRQQKDKARRQHPQCGQVALEVHHKNPYYQSRDDSDNNAVAVTRPEHAIEHFRLATNSTEWSDAKINYWAVNQIVKRMTPSELNEFNRKLVKN